MLTYINNYNMKLLQKETWFETVCITKEIVHKMKIGIPSSQNYKQK